MPKKLPGLGTEAGYVPEFSREDVDPANGPRCDIAMVALGFYLKVKRLDSRWTCISTRSMFMLSSSRRQRSARGCLVYRCLRRIEDKISMPQCPPLGAVLECTYGQLAENPDTRRLMDLVIDEVFQVAQAHNISLNWRTADEYRTHFYTRLVPPTAKHFPSMYYDVKAGKRLEIDALNGAIVKLAQEKGISVPVNETITLLLKAKEAMAARKHG